MNRSVLCIGEINAAIFNSNNRKGVSAPSERSGSSNLTNSLFNLKPFRFFTAWSSVNASGLKFGEFPRSLDLTPRSTGSRTKFLGSNERRQVRIVASFFTAADAHVLGVHKMLAPWHSL